MKITSARINWNHGWGNTPDLILETTDAPEFGSDEPIYTMQGNGVVWAEKDDVVSFVFMGNGMATSGNPDYRGFGGALVTRTLKDETVIKSNNAWSSSAKHVEDVLCQEVTGVGVGNALKLDLFKSTVAELGAYTVDDPKDISHCVISASPDEYRKAEESTAPV